MAETRSSFLLPIVIALGASGCSEPSGLQFRVEPKNRYTVTHSGTLAAGSEVHLSLQRLQNEQAFLVNLCDDPCSSSKQVFSVTGKGGDPISGVFALPQSGRYYFWIMQKSVDGFVGPARIEHLATGNYQFTATFAGGAVVTAEVASKGVR